MNEEEQARIAKLFNGSNQEDKLQVMFNLPGELPRLTDWRIVVIQLLGSIDRNTNATRDAVRDLLKEVREDANEGEA